MSLLTPLVLAGHIENELDDVEPPGLDPLRHLQQKRLIADPRAISTAAGMNTSRTKRSAAWGVLPAFPIVSRAINGATTRPLSTLQMLEGTHPAALIHSAIVDAVGMRPDDTSFSLITRPGVFNTS